MTKDIIEELNKLNGGTVTEYKVYRMMETER